MNEDDPHWWPVGQRWLEKIHCKKCLGVGFLICATDKICATCKGDGFVESSVGGVILCLGCQGERRTASDIKTSCEECKGRGYHPKIMQRFEATIACLKCEGTGELAILTEEEEEERCDTCEGSGRSTDVLYCSLPKWSSHPLNSKGGRKICWSEDDLNVDLKIDSGAFVEIVFCEECEDDMAGDGGGPDDSCSVCEGLHRVVCISTLCLDCEGSGWTQVMVENCRSERCQYCEHTGEAVISEVREV